MKSYDKILSVKTLLWYREFDRVNKPALLIPFVQRYTVKDLTEKVAAEGITSKLELHIYKDKALLTEGNHRISAYDNLKITKCPVTVFVVESLRELHNTLYDHTVARMKPINPTLAWELGDILQHTKRQAFLTIL